MLNKLSNQHKYFMIYSASMIVYGGHITALGPTIPYLSDKSGINETQYSFLFSTRSLGMIAGTFLLKILDMHTKIPNHYKIIACSVAAFVLLSLFCWAETTFSQAVWIFLGSSTYTILEVCLTLCVLETTPHQEMQYWLLLFHGMFGVGCIIVPYIVYIFETYAYSFLGFLLCLLIPLYLYFPSPQTINKDKSEQTNKENKQFYISRKAEYLLCAALFVYVGSQTTFGGWISSYSILAGVNQKQQAVFYPFLYWTTITIFRFILAYVKATSSLKFKKLLQLAVLTGIFTVILTYFSQYKFACYFSSIMFGISLSSIYPLVFSICTQFGFKISPEQTNHMVGAAVLGEGILVVFAGMLMQKVHINMIFYSMIAMALGMLLIRFFSIKQLEKLKQQQTIEIQLLPKKVQSNF